MGTLWIWPLVKKKTYMETAENQQKRQGGPLGGKSSEDLKCQKEDVLYQPDVGIVCRRISKFNKQLNVQKNKEGKSRNIDFI